MPSNTPPEPEPHEATEVPPWDSRREPEPAVQTWDRLTRPVLAVRVRSRWERCPIISVQLYRDGHVAVQVDIHLDSDTVYQARTYRWDPRAMYILRRGDPPHEL